MKNAEAALQALPDGVVLLDEHGHITYANDAAIGLFGQDLSDVVLGVPLPVDRVSEIGVRQRDGSITYVCMQAARAVISDTPMAVLSMWDITQRKLGELELAQAARLRDLNAAFASHEINSPLAAISIDAQMMLTHPSVESDPGLQASARRIIDAVTDAQRTAENLLSVTRAELGGLRVDPIKLDVSNAIESVVTATSGDAIEVDVEAGLTVWCDSHHFHRTVSNLVSNAFRYGRPPVEIAARRKGPELVLTVSDHGDGIPEGELDRMFQPFVRGARAEAEVKESLGLGLAVARMMIEANSGSLSYEPAATGGAAFAVRLPLAE